MKKHFLTCLFSLPLFSYAIAGGIQNKVSLEQKNPLDSSRLLRDEHINSLKALQPSMTGKTQRGNKYDLFGIKKGKEWTFLILDSTDFYSVRKVKGKDEMEEKDQSYTDMICLMIESKLIRQKKKPRNVDGLTFACYYKFKPNAKKMYRNYNKISRDAQFYLKNAKGGKKGRVKILDKALK